MADYGATIVTEEQVSQLVAGDFNAIKQGVVALGAGPLSRGTVLAMDAAGKWVQLAPAAIDGTEIARGILVEDVDATSADAKALVYLVGEYRLADLIWPAAITDAQKAAAILALQDRGIVVK
jgi:hypothetical protein